MKRTRNSLDHLLADDAVAAAAAVAVAVADNAAALLVRDWLQYTLAYSLNPSEAEFAAVPACALASVLEGYLSYPSGNSRANFH